ncbi:helix-turn-helix domain-containing protein [Thalassotalea sp. G20_0]|uniref:helix-turn-helix domain-containing protein n=1 Tax=Thalassotalea sp. G20_0 TaxID=2821093 RepID=UPI001AD994CC|nr:helix-turn-helix domain-containing protein [Thalassotalea sp. G20_0]MBO9497443.1 helix-turn-helix domain-containing protein [Thalassotalea sp. G20_0]
MPKEKSVAMAVLDTDQTSGYIGVAKTEIIQARITGQLSGLEPPPFIKIGRRVRYRIVDLDNWLTNQPAFKTLAEQEAANSKRTRQ